MTQPTSSFPLSSSLVQAKKLTPYKSHQLSFQSHLIKVVQILSLIERKKKLTISYRIGKQKGREKYKYLPSY